MNTKKRILVCDDGEGVRESLKLILSDTYNVDFAVNAVDAMLYLGKNPGTGLVMLDIKMPHMNGLEALKSIKKNHPTVNVIIVTGYQSAEIAAESLKNGASGYIPKPFDKEQILKAVHDCL